LSIEINALEKEILKFLLAGDDPTLEVLRIQYFTSKVIKRELTGVGFFLSFSVAPEAPRLESPKSLHFGDVKADIEGLQNGAGFVLHINEGAIDELEGYSYDEPWPVNVDKFHISYIDAEERDLFVLWDKWASGGKKGEN
jgi:hypothetical protein